MYGTRLCTRPSRQQQRPWLHQSVSCSPTRAGVNLPTEVSYYFEVDQETKEVTLDKSADQMSEHVQEGNPAGLRIRGGIGYEVPSTPQPSLDMRKRSGDGTVPYCSLSHTTQWKCQAQKEKRDVCGVGLFPSSHPYSLFHLVFSCTSSLLAYLVSSHVSLTLLAMCC